MVTTDIKLDSAVTANTKYEFGPKKYTLGATWNGKLASKASTLKAFYSNKDNLVAGEATVSVNKWQKANVTFNQNQVSMHDASCDAQLCHVRLLVAHCCVHTWHARLQVSRE